MKNIMLTRGSQLVESTGSSFGSNNEDDDYLTACGHCGAPLKSKWKGNRFCSHACYAASLRLPVEPRFWSHVNKQGPLHPVLGTRCWLWTANRVGHASKNYPAINSRHGQFTYSVNKRQHHVYAHRFAWELAHGPVPDGLLVCHRCDVPPCVNQKHLFLGTVGANMKDAAAKNRLTVPRSGLLSLFDRLTIYRAPAYPGVVRDLARQYHVTQACISVIRRGRFLGSGVWFGTKIDLRQESA